MVLTTWLATRSPQVKKAEIFRQNPTISADLLLSTSTGSLKASSFGVFGKDSALHRRASPLHFEAYWWVKKRIVGDVGRTVGIVGAALKAFQAVKNRTNIQPFDESCCMFVSFLSMLFGELNGRTRRIYRGVASRGAVRGYFLLRCSGQSLRWHR